MEISIFQESVSIEISTFKVVRLKFPVFLVENPSSLFETPETVNLEDFEDVEESREICIRPFKFKIVDIPIPRGNIRRRKLEISGVITMDEG